MHRSEILCCLLFLYLAGFFQKLKWFKVLPALYSSQLSLCWCLQLNCVFGVCLDSPAGELRHAIQQDRRRENLPAGLWGTEPEVRERRASPSMLLCGWQDGPLSAAYALWSGKKRGEGISSWSVSPSFPAIPLTQLLAYIGTGYKGASFSHPPITEMSSLTFLVFFPEVRIYYLVDVECISSWVAFYVSVGPSCSTRPHTQLFYVSNIPLLYHAP